MTTEKLNISNYGTRINSLDAFRPQFNSIQFRMIVFDIIIVLQVIDKIRAADLYGDLQ